MLAICGQRIKPNLVFCYITAALIGVFISVFWTCDVSYAYNLFTCFGNIYHLYTIITNKIIIKIIIWSVYGICVAVTMSLLYTINTEINGGNDTHIDREYTVNVMICGFGLFFGPIVSGLVLDVTE
jgi:hypothetical protein